MALTAGNVVVGVTGAVYVAPSGTTGPTDAATALNAAFKDVGYLGPNGITESNSTEKQDIVAWQRGDVVRSNITKSLVEYKFDLMESLNSAALSLFYGQTIAAGAGTYDIKGATGLQVAVVIDVIDGTNVIRRWIPAASVTERGDVTITNGDAVMLPVTLSAFPHASIGSAPVRVFTDPVLK